jgi:hypothetical protein
VKGTWYLKSRESQVNDGRCSLLSEGLTLVIIGLIFIPWCVILTSIVILDSYFSGGPEQVLRNKEA